MVRACANAVFLERRDAMFLIKSAPRMFDSEESRMQARSGDQGPQADIQQEKFKSALVDAIDHLPEREKLVLML